MVVLTSKEMTTKRILLDDSFEEVVDPSSVSIDKEKDVFVIGDRLDIQNRAYGIKTMKTKNYSKIHLTKNGLVLTLPGTYLKKLKKSGVKAAKIYDSIMKSKKENYKIKDFASVFFTFSLFFAIIFAIPALLKLFPILTGDDLPADVIGVANWSLAIFAISVFIMIISRLVFNQKVKSFIESCK